MTLCAITGTVKTPSGAVLASSTISFEPWPRSIIAMGGAAQSPETISAATNGSGVVSVTLADGQYVMRFTTSAGEVDRLISVPPNASADIAEILSTPSVTYEVVGWAEFQAIVAAAPIVYADTASGLSATADLGYFFARYGTAMQLYREVSGVAVPVYIEI